MLYYAVGHSGLDGTAVIALYPEPGQSTAVFPSNARRFKGLSGGHCRLLAFTFWGSIGRRVSSFTSNRHRTLARLAGMNAVT